MYKSHVDAHARSIEELTGEHPYQGKSMYIEHQRGRDQIIDDTSAEFRRRRKSPFAKPRPVTFHGNINWPPPRMSEIGNYASDWYVPREQSAVGQHVIYAANKVQQQQSYRPQMQQRQSTRPIGRYGTRPVSDSYELIGGGFRPPGSNRAADMFKRMREHTDQFAIDETCVGPQSLELARQGDFEGVPTPPPKQAGRQPSWPGSGYDPGPPPSTPPKRAPAARPAQQRPQAPTQPRPQARPQARPQPTPQQYQQPTPQQYQQPTPQQYQQGRTQTPPTQSRPMQPKSVNPPTPRGQTQFDARPRHQQQQQKPAIGCKWNRETTFKKFHGDVEPYKENYNRKAQGWASTYRDTYSSDDDSVDPYDTRRADYGPAPKLDLSPGFNAKKKAAFGDYNAQIKGWKSLGLEEEDAEGLFNPNRPKMSSLAAAFEEPRPRPGQRQVPQQRMSSARPHAGPGGWGFMESDDL